MRSCSTWHRRGRTAAYGPITRLTLLRGGSEPDLAAIAKGTDAFHRAAKVLDDQLQKRKFVTGDTLTVADSEVARYPVQPYGAIRRWHGELMALPAWRHTLAACALPAAAA